jgi:hypothetical protein
MKLIKTFLLELASNGKSFLVYILAQFPMLNDYPMLVGAIEEFIAKPTTGNAAVLGFQLFWLVATGHRAGKLLKAVMSKL